MKDRSCIQKINPSFIAITLMGISYCLSALKSGEFWVPGEFGPGGGAHRKWDTKNINDAVIYAYTDVFRSLDADFCFSLPENEEKKIDFVYSMICRRIPHNWYGPSYGTTWQWSGQLWWGLHGLCPGGGNRAAQQFFQSSQQLCWCYWSEHAIVSYSAYGCVWHCQQQPAHPLQRQQQQQQWHQQHHQHEQPWEYRISRQIYNCRGCDVTSRLGMVSVVGLKISIVCYLILGFIDIS